MATKYAQTGGNFSAGGAGGIWYDAASGGSEVAKPTGTDIAEANGNTVVIDEDVACGGLTNANGGKFTVATTSSARTIAAPVTASAVTCVEATLSASNLLTIDGDITGGSASGAMGVAVMAHGKLAIGTSSNTRTVTGGSAGTGDSVGVYTGNYAIYDGTWYANLTATTHSAASIRLYTSTTVLTITGTLTAATVVALKLNSSGKLKLNGSQIGSSASFPFMTMNSAASAAATVYWDAAAGSTLKWYDSSGDPHVLKVPDYPAEADVEASVDYDYGNYTGTLSASCDYPAEADVQSGVSFGSGVYTGTFTAPAVGDVQAGVGYGAGGTEYEGTFAVPSVGDVATGVGYGAGGTEFEGTLEISGLSETQMEAILDARGITEPASDTADSVARRGASAVTLSDVGSGGGAIHSTTIATLASQTSFTLTAGSADDDAYNYCVVVVTDESTATQKCVGVISDYTGLSKTVTLGADPAIFTMAAGDTVEIYPPVGLRWINGAAASGSSTVDANVVSVSDDETAADTLELFVEALDQATGQLDSGSLAAGTITAATFAADVDDEVLAWIVDDATKIDASALNTATGTTVPAIKTKTDYLPSATAGSSGGVLIAGSNAATTFATLSVTGQMDAGNLLVDGTTVLTGNFEITGTTKFHGTAQFDSTLNVVGRLTAAGGVTVDDTFLLLDTTTAGTLGKILVDISGYVDCLPATWVVPPAGSDWTATRAGYIDKLNVTGALAHSDAAATYKADVSALATSDELTALASYGDSHWATATGFSTLDAADVRTALGMAAADLDDQLTAIGGTVDSLSSGVTVSDKTGFKLASDGLDAIATTAPSGPATTFREMVVQTWRRFFRKATKTSTAITTYADDGTTVITTQAIESVGSNEEQGAAT